jgi:hypothetical protein
MHSRSVTVVSHSYSVVHTNCNGSKYEVFHVSYQFPDCNYIQHVISVRTNYTRISHLLLMSSVCSCISPLKNRVDLIHFKADSVLRCLVRDLLVLSSNKTQRFILNTL